MKVYLLRHGETEWNVLRRVQGALDSPLTQNGVQQAENASRRLAQVDFAAAFASPSPRTQRTASLIARRHIGLVVQTEPSLREFSFGVYEGHSLDGMAQEAPELWRDFQRAPSTVTSPGGDCMLERVAESKAFVDKLVQTYFGQNVLCVSHGFGVCYFMAAALGIPLEAARCFSSGNTALTVIEYKQPNEPVVRVFGDTSHNDGPAG